jgi:hypothetical protein
MKNVFMISSNVRNRMKNLSQEEQDVILETFVCDEVKKTPRTHVLSPVMELYYTMIHDYIMRDPMCMLAN